MGGERGGVVGLDVVLHEVEGGGDQEVGRGEHDALEPVGLAVAHLVRVRVRVRGLRLGLGLEG